MPIPQTVAFFLINVTLTGAAANNNTPDQINYKVIAYIPGWTGDLTACTSLPYREKISGNFLNGLQSITWGKSGSNLPNETPTPQSPFPDGIRFSYLIDGAFAQKNPATGQLVGFGQAADNRTANNLCVYNVAVKDQKIISLGNRFDINVEYVCTNGPLPQSWKI